jgi:hypothetical protein
VQTAAGQYQPEVESGVLGEECRAVLKSFFAEMRARRAKKTTELCESDGAAT